MNVFLKGFDLKFEKSFLSIQIFSRKLQQKVLLNA
jgi:hypothetical protein